MEQEIDFELKLMEQRDSGKSYSHIPVIWMGMYPRGSIISSIKQKFHGFEF